MEINKQMWNKFNKQLNNVSFNNFNFLNSQPINTTIGRGKKIDVINNLSNDTKQYLLENFNESYILEKFNRNSNNWLYAFGLMLDLLGHDKVLNIKNILEIGGGIGGLCRVCHSLIPKIDKYVNVDNQEMISCCNKFLEGHNISIQQTIPGNINYLSNEKFDLFLSSFCLSETPYEYRNMVLSKFLPNVQYVFIVNSGDMHNEINYWLNYYSFNFQQTTFLKHKNMYVYAGEK